MAQVSPVFERRKIYKPDEEEAAQEAKIVFNVLKMAADLVLDLDLTVARAKELFVLALYDRAEARFRTSTRISLAFDTALRTVKKIKKRYKENAVEEVAGQDYNLRKKVYLMIMDRPMELDEIARELPINYEVNYARLAIETLMEMGLCEEKLVGRGKVVYRGLNKPVHMYLSEDDEFENLIEGFGLFLSGLRKAAKQILVQGDRETSLARRFVVRVRPEDMAEIKEEVRLALIRKLMELEQKTEDLDEDEIQEMEVLLGVTPA
jgi:hypothetical protein